MWTGQPGRWDRWEGARNHDDQGCLTRGMPAQAEHGKLQKHRYAQFANTTYDEAPSIAGRHCSGCHARCLKAAGMLNLPPAPHLHHEDEVAPPRNWHQSTTFATGIPPYMENPQLIPRRMRFIPRTRSTIPSTRLASRVVRQAQTTPYEPAGRFFKGPVAESVIMITATDQINDRICILTPAVERLKRNSGLPA